MDGSFNKTLKRSLRFLEWGRNSWPLWQVGRRDKGQIQSKVQHQKFRLSRIYTKQVRKLDANTASPETKSKERC